MKIALISDIHSNATYLKQVLDSIRKQNIEDVYCLGDLMGYYNEPNEVIEICRNNNIKAVKGNHENYLLNKINYNKDKEHLYNIENQRKILNKNNLDFLADLPDYMEISLNNKNLYLTHSLPNDCIKYAYETAEIDKDFISKYDYYCYGHTHIPVIAYKDGVALINPGSVGQPRDYTKQPSYAIIDLDNNSITLNKIDADTKKYTDLLREQGFSEEVILILERENNAGSRN